jgi:hypothetical protein
MGPKLAVHLSGTTPQTVHLEIVSAASSRILINVLPSGNTTLARRVVSWGIGPIGSALSDMMFFSCRLTLQSLPEKNYSFSLCYFGGFASSEPCAAGAPPRMKKGRMPAGRSDVRDRFDTRAASRTSSVIQDVPQAPPSVARRVAKHVREHLTRLGHPVTRPCLYGGVQ